MRALPLLLLLPLCAPALAEQTSAVSLTLNGGTVAGLTNRLTGEACTLGPRAGDQTSLLRLWEKPAGRAAAVRDLVEGQEGATLTCEAAADGADVVVRQAACRPAGGLAGVGLALAPIDAEKYALLIPGVGGVALDRDSAVADCTYSYPGSWATPALIVQGEKGGVLISADRPAESFKALRVVRLATAWQVMLLTDAPTPFAQQTECASARWRFTAYTGPWTVAAALQRDRLRKEFALMPLAQRQPAWLPHIRCLVRVTSINGFDKPLQALAAQLDPGKTLLYVPDWRTNPYDVMYPDYTAREDAVRFVRAAQALGFRVMVHGNLVGLSPFHPRLDEFRDVLERDPVSGELIGWWLDRDVQNKIYCLNPASAKARKLLVDSFVASYKQVGFDALHLDFPLIVNADGGPIERRNPIQGTTALLRELQAAMPGVPLGTEGIFDYMLDCSFAQLGEPFWNIEERMGRYHPVRAAMFSDFCNTYGHLGIPDQQADLQAYLSFTDVHDRVGALPTLSLNCEKGLDLTSPGTAYALREARYFCEHEPLPDFPATLQTVAAAGDPPQKPYYAWRQSDGREIAVVQTPAGRKWLAGSPAAGWRELWRVHQRVTTIAGDLHLPGWLAYNDRALFGLDPRAIYLPQPGRPDPRAFHLTAAGAPVQVTLCGSDSRRDLIRLVPLQADALDLLSRRPDRVGIILKGQQQPMGRGGGFSVDSGCCGGLVRRGIFAHPPWQVPEFTQGGAIDGASYGEYHLRLPDLAGLQFAAALGLRDLPSPDTPGGDGVTFRVLIDGQEVFSRHHATRNWEDMTVDLSRWRGREVALRLVTHTGPAGRPDFDWALWGEPRLTTAAPAASVPLSFTGAAAGSALLVCDAAGTRPAEAAAAEVKAALPATLLCLHRQADLPLAVPGALAKLPYTPCLMNGGVLTAGSVYGSGGASAWKDGETTLPGISGHTPAWGQTHLEWLLRLPAEPLNLRFAAAVVKAGEEVSFAVQVNGTTVWRCGFPGSGKSTPGSVDLSKWAGQPVLLSLVTDSEGSNNCDWAVWVDPKLR